MSTKKRKSTDDQNERPAKKPQTPSTVTVRHVTGPDIAKPVVATIPGANIPTEISFDSFSKATGSQLLLHSSEHSTIDYTAVESSTANSTDKHLKHYVAVFDPETGKLQVTEAKSMVIRSCVRKSKPDSDEDNPEAEEAGQSSQPVTNYSSRAALTAAFGTKKSKKAVQAIAENRLLARTDDTENPLSKAILSSTNDDEEDTIQSVENVAASQRVNKPLPPADLDIEDISQVYPLASLIFPSSFTSTLNSMPITTWQDRISSHKAITSTSRFIANRVAYLVKVHLSSPADETLLQNIQVLRYIQLLLEVLKHISQQPPRRSLAPPFKWPEGTISDAITGTDTDNNNYNSNDTSSSPPTIPSKTLFSIYQHFFPNRSPTTHNMTLLRTTILALTLQIPPPSLNPGKNQLITEPTDIALDMAIPLAEVLKLYRELGCRIDSPKEGEIEMWGMQKMIGGGSSKKKSKTGDSSSGSGVVAVPRPKIAKLRFPIEFPKLSQGARGRR